MQNDFSESASPLALFADWMGEAKASEVNDPNAMALATVDDSGMPNVRIVLLKGWDQDGFVFYTNTESQKGRELLSGGKAAAVLHWKTLGRQVRLRGPVTSVSDAEADAYYASRARASRVGAWASQQSRPLADRATLEAAVARYDEAYPGEDVPRPPHWSGFRIRPISIEFWHDRPYRLHDRIVFWPSGEGWSGQRLYP